MAAFDVSQLNNLFKKIDSVSGGTGSKPIGNTGVSYNDIAWFANAVTTASTEELTPEQKASMVNGLVEKALKIFESVMGNREAQAAKKETDKETKATQELLEKSKNLEAQLEGDLSAIQGNIEAQTAIITEAQGLLTKTQDAITEKQKQIEEKIKQIEEKQTALRNAKTDEEKAAILAEIQGFAVEIAEISATIEVDSENIANLTEAVDDTVVDIEASTQKLAETQEQGLQTLGEQAAEAGKQTADVVETSTTGNINKAEKEVLQKTAETSSSNPITGSTIAPKLYMAASDKEQAASTRLGSIQTNMNKIAQGIGGLSNATQVLAGFQNSIGGALNNYSEMFGQWEAQLQPVILSLGSFDTLATGLDELNTAVETDLETLSAEVDKDGNVQKTDRSTGVQPAQPAQQPSPEQQQGSSPESQFGSEPLLTPDFEIKKLSFGL